MGMLKNEDLHSSYRTASGPIPYNLTNDYMFRVVLQENELVLRGLIGSLLNLEQSEIRSTVVTNPIKLGEQIDDKTFVLDIHVLLNDDTHLNLELQLLNQGNWPERSLSYLCRSFDSLQHGEDYIESMRAIHIGILDFTLFEDYPEFYADYRMMNIKNHHIYSDKFILNVLDLTQIELATDEDRKCELDYWARLFKAGTWEDLRMVAEKNESMNAAAAEMYIQNANDNVKEQCRVREEYIRQERWMKKKYDEQKKMLAAKEQELAEANKRIAELEAKLSNR